MQQCKGQKKNANNDIKVSVKFLIMEKRMESVLILGLICNDTLQPKVKDWS